MQPATLGTAGPAGHGKTALVRALSDGSTPPDAPPTEPSVELGFAYHDIAGQRFGVVDLPGTARLVRGLIADAHGIDLFLLVVAADAGVLPQTEECVDILHLLDARDLVFVLTKIDLVSERRVDQVRAQVASLAAGSRFSASPVLAVSSTTGDGISHLRHELHRRAPGRAPRATEGWFRMYVDRSFFVAGRGLTVTGTVLSGRVRTGDAVAFRPGGSAGEVARVQVHGVTVAEAGAGQRVAVRLSGTDRKAIRRGAMLADPRNEFPTDRIDCWLEVRPSAVHGVRSFDSVEIDVGTVETAGSVVVLEPSDVLAPGTGGLCQLTLEREMLLSYGDRFVLRPVNGTRTAAGGLVLHPFAVRHAGTDHRLTERLTRLRSPALAARMLAFHELLPEVGAPVEYTAQALGRTVDDIRRAAGGIPDLLPLPAEPASAYALRARWAKLVASAADGLARYHRAHRETGIDAESLRSRLRVPVPPRLLDAVVARLVGDEVLTRDGDLLRLAKDGSRPHAEASPVAGPRHEPAGDPITRVRQAIRTGAAAPPDLRQLVEATGLGPERVTAIVADLVSSGELVEVGGGVAFDCDVYARARQQLVDLLGTQPEVTVGEYRTLIGSSRKYALMLLEHFDAASLTERIGDARRLKS